MAMNSRILSESLRRPVQRWQAPDMNLPPPPPPPPPPQPEQHEPEDSTPPPLTIEQIEQIQREAHDEGFKQGYEEGLRQGHAEGLEKGQEEGRKAGEAEIRAESKKLHLQTKKVQTEAGHLRQVLDSLLPFVEDLDQQLEQELVTLATVVARQLVRRELQTHPGQIVAVVREALAVLPSSERRLRIHLHPKDAEVIRDALHLAHIDQPWEIVEDPTLTRGGTRLETAVSQIDATVEHRLNTVIAAMWGSERRVDEPPSRASQTDTATPNGA